MTPVNHKSISLAVCIMVITLLLGLINIYHHLADEVNEHTGLVENRQNRHLNTDDLQNVLDIMSKVNDLLGDISQNQSEKIVKTSPAKLQKYGQRDSELINQIKNGWLHLPSKLNLTEPDRIDYSQNGQSQLLDRLLDNRTHGFYIECGAFDGERFSNSLYFERYREWEGLLIEADPYLYQTILNKNRKAYSLNVCLSPTEYASELNYTVLKKSSYMGGLVEQHKVLSDLVENNGDEITFIQIQCFPFYAILLAIGNPHVNLFSLDIEGAEVDVLKTIPFNEVNIDMILIEVGPPGEIRDDKVLVIENLLQPYGYKNLHIKIFQDILMSKIH